jgi:hypothetical protein
MKNIDIKSTVIGALLTSTIFLGIAATSNIGNGTVKLDGPVDVRLSFGSSKATASNTSTPTELGNRDTLTINLKHTTDRMLLSHTGIN